MKTLKTYLFLAAGLLFAGVANAQVIAPQPALQGPGSLSLGGSKGPNNTAGVSPNRANYLDDSYVQQLGNDQYASVIQGGAGQSADIVQTSSATKSDAYQTQFGGVSNNRDRAYIEQRGERDIASQYQDGRGNEARIVQQAGAGDRAYQEQLGNNNTGDINQSGSVPLGGSFAQQYQQGNNNDARTTQRNGVDWSTVEQRGNGNTALVFQQ